MPTCIQKFRPILEPVPELLAVSVISKTSLHGLWYHTEEGRQNDQLNELWTETSAHLWSLGLIMWSQPWPARTKCLLQLLLSCRKLLYSMGLHMFTWWYMQHPKPCLLYLCNLCKSSWLFLIQPCYFWLITRPAVLLIVVSVQKVATLQCCADDCAVESIKGKIKPHLSDCRTEARVQTTNKSLLTGAWMIHCLV